MTDEAPNSALLEDFLSKMPDDMTTTQISAILLTIADRYMASAPHAVIEMLVQNAVVYASARGVQEAVPSVLRATLTHVQKNLTKAKAH